MKSLSSKKNILTKHRGTVLMVVSLCALMGCRIYISQNIPKYINKRNLYFTLKRASSDNADAKKIEFVVSPILEDTIKQIGLYSFHESASHYTTGFFIYDAHKIVIQPRDSTKIRANLYNLMSSHNALDDAASTAANARVKSIIDSDYKNRNRF